MLLLCFVKADAALILGKRELHLLCQTGPCPQCTTLVLPANPHTIHTVFAHLPLFHSFTPILESLCKPENNAPSEFIFFHLDGYFQIASCEGTL